jgi:hypothetical protein
MQQVTSSILIVMLMIPVSLGAQSHVVSEGELRGALMDKYEQRQADIEAVQGLFHSEPGRAVLEAANIELEMIESAVASLNEAELERLAARADKVQADMVGGALTNQQITYILIALATAVIVIVLS